MAAELPSQLISKKLGPDRWIPAQITLWSVVAAAQAGLNGRTSFYVTRALLGALEGGFIPDLILWLSYFYKSGELTLRLSWFWVSRYLTMVVTSVMAYGLLHMRGVHGMAGWQWLFLIEGLITLAIGIASFFLMPASATETKTWFRPKGWFTEREVGIVVNRVLRDDPSKGDMNNRTGLSLRNLWDAVADYDLWPVSEIEEAHKQEWKILTSRLALRHWLRLHDSSVYTRPVHHLDSPLSRIRPVRSQSPLHPQPGHQLLHALRCDVVQRIHRSAHACSILSEHLDIPLPSSSALVARCSGPGVGNFRPHHRPAQLSLHTRDQRLTRLAQLWISTHAICFCGVL